MMENKINEVKNAGQQKKKYQQNHLKIILLAAVFLAVIGGGIFAWKKMASKKDVPKSESTNIIDQYRENLPDLKNKANKSSSVEDLQAYGIAQYATGDQAGAIVTYEKQIEKEPNSVVAHSGLANALRDQKKFEQAIVEYEKVIELAPTDISAYVNLASVYQYQLSQKDKAVEVYKRAIEKNPKSTDLLVLEALLYEQMNDKDNAKKIYQQILGIDGDNVVAKGGLERLVQ